MDDVAVRFCNDSNNSVFGWYETRYVTNLPVMTVIWYEGN